MTDLVTLWGPEAGKWMLAIQEKDGADSGTYTCKDLDEVFKIIREKCGKDRGSSTDHAITPHTRGMGIRTL